MIDLKHSIEAKKSVTIISGFLGAGKTSFLNEFISYNKDIKPVIIENEFGKEGIDAGLIVASEANIFEFNAGCLCCNLNEDLYDLLGVLWQRKGEFDELIIETTGIADPATVAQPFIVHSQVKQRYQLERVICIVDAHLIEFELTETEAARKQIVFADIIVINKCDTVAPEYVAQMKILLRNINPFATIFSGDKSAGYPLKDILQLIRNDFDSNTAYDLPVKETAAMGGEPQAVQPKCKTHQHKNIASLSFVFDEPFDLDLFSNRLWIFLNLQANDIYRVKGFVWTKGNERKMLVQSVSNILAITEDNEWRADEVKKSRLVFIGRDIKYKGIENMLRHCVGN
ncbi:MAG: GTP-binding protein [Niabella sp.]